MPASRSKEDDDGRSLPWLMISIVGLALLLLGIGGYGVVQQRGELQAEIRELQARLATTITPEEAEAERERQREVTMVNESLTAEMEALVAENTALSEQLSTLEARVGETQEAEAAAAKAATAAQVAREQAAATAKRNREQATAQSSAAQPASDDAAAEGWFVNFGSYAQRDVADRWAGKLNVDSGRVVVQTASAAGKTLYRVRIVALASQDQAERVATQLERQYQLPRLWVGRN